MQSFSFIFKHIFLPLRMKMAIDTINDGIEVTMDLTMMEMVIETTDIGGVTEVKTMTTKRRTQERNIKIVSLKIGQLPGLHQVG